MRKNICTLLFVQAVVFSHLLGSVAQAQTIPGFFGQAANAAKLSSAANPAILTTALPDLRSINPAAAAIQTDAAANSMTITQNAANAVLQWNSFNIGSQASVTFNQAGGKALNRIYDAAPSEIYGRLTADGTIYLINQNGILFGPGAQINVHSLVASSLNLRDTDFLAGLSRFRAEDYRNAEPDHTANPNRFYDAGPIANALYAEAATPQAGSDDDHPGVVANHGQITGQHSGKVLLMGRLVENSGDIHLPFGHIGLAAGSQLDPVNVADVLAGSELAQNTRTADIAVISKGAGSVANLAGGTMATTGGIVGLYGKDVRQDGIIRSVTAVEKDGMVELRASNSVVFGENSRTATPITDDPKLLNESYATTQGKVSVSGLKSPDELAGPEPLKAAARLALDGSAATRTIVMEKGADIAAPAGSVRLLADRNIHLESTSAISVKGEEAALPASANLASGKLTSNELREDKGQQGGLLHGEQIVVDAQKGSVIGEVSGMLKQNLTAAQRATAGGTIDLTAGKGDLIVKSGAVLDISGGGITFAAGTADTTQLLAGTTLYDISEAPQWLRYDTIFGPGFAQEKVHSRYGITEAYEGVYLAGSALPLRNIQSGFYRGSNAGTLNLSAGRIILDGNIQAGARAGIYQTKAADERYYADPAFAAVTRTLGLAAPANGSVTIGKYDEVNDPADLDLKVGEIAVQATPPALADGFSATSAFPADRGDITVLSAERINSWGAGSISFYTNHAVTIGAGADLNLGAGAAFTAYSRRIVNNGSVNAPGGLIKLTAADNATSTTDHFPAAAPEGIFLNAGSLLSTAGERVDLSNAAITRGGPTPRLAFTDGGQILLKDETRLNLGDNPGGKLSLSGGVAIAQGARVDVSGGHTIGQDGEVSGGDAGLLNISSYVVAPDGDLRGLSLPGGNGGNLSLSTGKVTVVPAAGGLAALPGASVITDNRFVDTGFSAITIASEEDLTVGAGVSLAPSTMKLTAPQTRAGQQVAASITNHIAGSGGTTPAGEGLVRVALADAGDTSIRLKAGVEVDRWVPSFKTNPNDVRMELAAGAQISAGPRGAITLEAPQLTLDTVLLSAPGGSISLKARLGDDAEPALWIKGASAISAAGYLGPADTPSLDLGPVMTAGGGGTITLAAGSGSIRLDPLATVDVSGSAATATWVREKSGLTTVARSFVSAGAPGVLNITHAGTADLAGQILGHCLMDGLAGGTLRLDSGDAAMTVDAALIGRFMRSGFDDLTFASKGAVALSGDMNIRLGRHLAIEAPLISAGGTDQVVLSAPWIEITNAIADSTVNPVKGTAHLSLAADFIDVAGSTRFDGFDTVELNAGWDLRLSDAFLSKSLKWEGRIEMPGNLVIQAGRTYPTTASRFTLHADQSLSVLAGRDIKDLPIYSAAGQLIIETAAFSLDGHLAAPMGAVVIGKTVAGRNSADPLKIIAGADSVFLGEGSLISVAGDQAVAYGQLGSDFFWEAADKTKTSEATTTTVTGVPAKTIAIQADAATVSHGAVLDIAGGGSVFAYRFQPDLVSGYNDPLGATAGRLVIVPAGRFPMPGKAVYLEGPDLPAAGTYCVVDNKFAFVPGAMVLEPLAGNVAGARQTIEGYAVVGGYETDSGTGLRSAAPRYYALRTAADVVQEGHYLIAGQPAAGVLTQGHCTQTSKDLAPFTAGASGSVALRATTAVFDAAVTASYLSGYGGGSLMIGGQNINVSEGAHHVAGQVNLSPATLSAGGFASISLGDDHNTAALTFWDGHLTAPSITLAAKPDGTVSLKDSVQVNGLGDPGTVELKAGTVVTEEGSLVHARHEVTLNTPNLTLDGDLQIDTSALKLAGNAIKVVPEGYSTPAADTNDCVFIKPRLWNLFNTIETITLASRSDLVFVGDISLSVPENLTIDSPRIGGEVFNGSNQVGLAAAAVTITNASGIIPGSAAAGPAGTNLNLTATRDIVLGPGETATTGFQTVALTGGQNLVFKGKGTFTAGGDLLLDAPRLTTAYVAEGRTAGGALVPLQAADYAVAAPNRTLTVTRMDGGTGQQRHGLPGDRLTLSAGHIDFNGTIDMPGGKVTLSAAGAVADGKGLLLGSDSRILVAGIDHEDPLDAGLVPFGMTDGGELELLAAAGKVVTTAGATIDVSAGNGGRAGKVAITSATSQESLFLSPGTRFVAGADPGQSGGRFSLHTHSVADYGAFDALLGTINDSRVFAAAFNDTIDVRVKSGGLDLTDVDVEARTIVLTADSGAITIGGTLKADAAGDGGSVALNARTLSLKSTARIDAAQGEVFLHAADGDATDALSFASGATIDASGGSVHLRAKRNSANNDVNIQATGAAVSADSVWAEGYSVYTEADGQLTSADFGFTSAYYTQAKAFATKTTGEPDIARRLQTGLGSAVTLLPGVEIQASVDSEKNPKGKLELKNDWSNLGSTDSTTGWSFNGKPGVLTLRAAGDLSINGNLKDTRTGSGTGTWHLNLIAGADLQSAGLQATKSGTGNLTLATGKAVYTENGLIRFASGGNTDINTYNRETNSMRVYNDIGYNVGTRDGTITGRVGGDLNIKGGGVIQTATGDIDIAVRGNLIAEKSGSLIGTIRTLGEQVTINDDWYGQSQLWFATRNGGDIALAVGGNIQGQWLNGGGWDRLNNNYIMGDWYERTKWSASFDTFSPTQGIATLAGGDVTIRAGADVRGQIGTFSDGNLLISAGGQINGRFLNGQRTLDQTGNPAEPAWMNLYGRVGFGIDGGNNDYPLELFHTRAGLFAFGSIRLGTVLNPAVATNAPGGASALSYWDLGYSTQSGVSVQSVNGGVSLAGRSMFYSAPTSFSVTASLLPPVVSMVAAGDILLQNNLFLSPGATNNLRLIAGGDVSGSYLLGESAKRAAVFISDANPAIVYAYYGNGVRYDKDTEEVIARDISFWSLGEHEKLANIGADPPAPLHPGQDAPVQIVAGGDLRELRLTLNHSAQMVAGRDISNIYYQGQNIVAGDTTTIKAGGDIAFGRFKNIGADFTTKSGIDHKGPGLLLVQAGNAIDLGTSQIGILSSGNVQNVKLDNTGGDLVIAAGFVVDRFDMNQIDNFFVKLRDEGEIFSRLLADGDKAKAAAKAEQIRSEVYPLLLGAGSSGSGTISLEDSQISTQGEMIDLLILAAGNVNVGRTSVSQQNDSSKNTGFYTAAGGAIGLFAVGDINVNESRIMTFRGGDIMVVSDAGNINAGKGSRTQISQPPPRPVYEEYKDENGNTKKRIVGSEFPPPAAGSGIRTLTYDPDGAGGPKSAPEAGWAYLYAFNGEIDAGEAGIAARGVILGATEGVKNAQNIDTGSESVGVPLAAENSGAIGALAGAGSMATAGTMNEMLASGDDAKKKAAEQQATGLAQALIPKWLDVKVIGFEEEG